jgi:hypothetical protein
MIRSRGLIENAVSRSRIKGTVSQDFRLSVFFINQTHILVGPWLTGQNRFAYGFVFAEIFDAKVAKIGFRGVNDPAETNFFSEFPNFFLP